MQNPPIVLFQTFGSEGLQLVDHTEIVSSGQAVLQLTFDPGAFGRSPVTIRCQLDHPFYVKNKGGGDNDDITSQTWCKPIYTVLFWTFFSQAGRHFIPA